MSEPEKPHPFTVALEQLNRAGKIGGLPPADSTTTKGSFELLWHAVSQPAPVVILAKAGR